jgi:hypothetical protein
MSGRLVGCVAVSVLALGLAGCGSDGDAPAATASATAGPATADAAAQVRRIVVSQKDLLRDYSVELYPEGDRVEGETTLDYCGYRFTTERHRVARRQVRIMLLGRYTGVSNEVVVYDTPAQAAKALEEFRTAVRTCRARTSAPAGDLVLRWDSSRLTSDQALPVEDNAVARARITTGGRRHQYATLFMQRGGAVLNGVYLQVTTKPDAETDAAVRQVAIATGKRLAGTSASV